MRSPESVFLVLRRRFISSAWGTREGALLEMRRVRKDTGEHDITIKEVPLQVRDATVPGPATLYPR